MGGSIAHQEHAVLFGFGTEKMASAWDKIGMEEKTVRTICGRHLLRL
jgi:hypothetical protein